MKELFQVRIRILWEFTTLNAYINAERSNRYAASSIKKVNTEAVCLQAQGVFVPEEEYPVRIHFDWVCKNKRTDPDNIRFATKFVLDGLVEAGVLRNDTWKEIAGFCGDTYTVAPGHEGVFVTIYGGSNE